MSELTEVEKIIASINDADEIEIMEFDFDPCFSLLKALEQANKELKEKFEQVESMVHSGQYFSAEEMLEELLKVLMSDASPKEPNSHE